MNLCVFVALAVLCTTAAQEDLASSADSTLHCHASNEVVNSDCHVPDSPDSVHAEKGRLSADAACGQECADNEASTRNSSTVDLLGNNTDPVPDAEVASLQTIPTDSPKVPSKTDVTSQRAIELLVSTWNDLKTWSKRNDTSSLCQQDIERTIVGYNDNERWALQMFDAWAKPGPSLLEGRSAFSGNYYQCKNTRAPKLDQREGFSGSYSVVDLANITTPLNESFFTLRALIKVQLGTCLPDSCSEADITELFKERVQALNFTSVYKVLSTDIRTNDREYRKFTYIALIIVLVVGTLTVFGTAIDLAATFVPRSTKQTENLNGQTGPDKSDQALKKQTSPGKPGQTLNGQTSLDKSEQALKDQKSVTDKPHQGILVKILLSFSAYSNGRRLLSTTQAPRSITVIPGIRFLTMSWIVVGHTNFLLMSGNAINIIQGVDSVIKYRIFDIITNMHFGVDTFFTISGFLVSYLTIKRVIEKGWSFNWKHFFLHRYWRLTPTFFITFLLVGGLQRFFVSGAVSPSLQPADILACEKNWWSLPFYLNNMLSGDVEDVCFSHSWSLSADFQFYLLSPLMMIPFYYHKVAGLFSCLTFVIGQWILVGTVSYALNGTISMLGYTIDVFRFIYIPFFARIAPFAIGVLAGYVLSVNDGRINMSKNTVIVGWIVATVAAGTVIFGVHGDLSREVLSSRLVAAFYNALSRSVWGASICWVLIACTSGYGGPVTTFLSWSPFTSLGRLTYIGYLIQMPVSTVIFQNLEQATYMSLSTIATFGAVDLVYTCLVSAVLVICVELPTFNLEKVIRDHK